MLPSLRWSLALPGFAIILPLVLTLGATSSPEDAQQETRPRGVPEHSETFSFHLVQEPHTLNPYLYRTGQTSHLLSNLLRGLYRFDSEKGVVEEGARRCDWKSPLRLECQLDKRVRWSNGRVVSAADYVRGFRALMDPVHQAVGAELLFNLKNASAIFQKKKPLTDLGVSAPAQDRLVFEFEKPDPEFTAKLTADAMTPVPEDQVYSKSEPQHFLSNGPYQLETWIAGQKITLTPNRHYLTGAGVRPVVEIYFIEDDKTALRLYRQGKLSFLRRLPPHLISEFEKTADFHKVDTARIDYIGFGPRLRDQPDLRKALALGLKYTELQKIYRTASPIGCPGLPTKMLPQPACYSFQLQEAKKQIGRLPKELSDRKWTFMFSRMGGKGPEQGAVWMQRQWRKHLGVETSLQPEEQGVFLERLRTQSADLFRKGVPLLYPSCLAALSTFSKNGPENFIGFDDPEFERLIESWGQAKSVAQKNRICQEGLRRMMGSFAWIPLGRIEWSFLASPKFQGWSLNEMGQLDLSRLEPVRNR